uniref:Uncharacterized protein n=1 Tax=Denticeps clupeoides TaxID=299321 RepID=A0AAY4ECG0_9TELE
MEQEHTGKEPAAEVEMTIPGLDWGMEDLMQKDLKKVPQKKVPYAKPIPPRPARLNKHRLCPPPGLGREQGPVHQPHQLKIERIAQLQSDQGLPPSAGTPGQMPPFQGQGGPMAPQGFPQSMAPQQMPHSMPPMAPGGMQGSFMSQGPPGHNQVPPQGMMGPPDFHGPQGMQRHTGPHRNMGPQGPHGMQGPRGMQGPSSGGMQGPQGGMMPPPSRGQGLPQGGIMHQDMRGPAMMGQQGMMGPPSQNPSRTHGSMHNMQGPPPSYLQQGKPGQFSQVQDGSARGSACLKASGF